MTAKKNPLISELIELHFKLIASGGRAPIDAALSFLRAEYGLTTRSKLYEQLVVPTNEVKESIRHVFDALDVGDCKCIYFAHTYFYYNDSEIVLAIRQTSQATGRSYLLTGDWNHVVKVHAQLKELLPNHHRPLRSVHVHRGEIDDRVTMVPNEPALSVAPPHHYPYFALDVHEQTLAFLESKNNIMLMVGPPGTGKSTYMRAMTSAMGERGVYVIDNTHLLSNPCIGDYITTLPHDAVIMIEDADLFVSKRENGNEQMSQLLNLADGIIASSRKFIISTNLPSVNKVDPALIRPGRCFKIMEFRNLTPTEAMAVYRDDFQDLRIPTFTRDMALAEVLNYTPEVELGQHKAPAFGFNG